MKYFHVVIDQDRPKENLYMSFNMYNTAEIRHLAWEICAWLKEAACEVQGVSRLKLCRPVYFFRTN